MNKSSFFAFTLFALSSVSLAAENTQLDRIENKVDKVVDAVVIDDPLKNKTFGIEVNPIRLLLFNGEQKSFSGTVSLFNVFDNAELAFPVFIGKSKADIFSHRGDFYSATVDAHYRNFLGTTRRGFYLAGFTRLAALRGTEGRDYEFIWDNTSAVNKRSSELKLGLGFGIGYRIFSKSGLYWGTSLSIGRYLIGESDKYVDNTFLADDDAELIVDFELLKFGLLF